MSSWFAKIGAALGLDKDTRSLDAALDEDSARAARGVTPIRDVTDRSHTLELRWPGRSSIPGLSVGQRLEVEGTVGRVGERLVIINPLYRVIAGEG